MSMKKDEVILLGLIIAVAVTVALLAVPKKTDTTTAKKDFIDIQGELTPLSPTMGNG